ncbi:MAG: hypothetical protein Q8N26_38290 [Myxococcales bacterium]|nr:hypothetical protein [Myxococcales bacterium]
MKTLVAMVVLVSASVFAAPVGVRSASQQARINQGVRTGELNRHEAARLQAQQNRIERHIVRDHIDGGGMTAAERSRIQAQQNQLNRRIAVQKHDGQSR